MSHSQGLTIGELEANYSLYCKALRILIKEGKTVAAIQRTVAWSRLEQLHTCLPSRYKSPDYLCVVLKSYKPRQFQYFCFQKLCRATPLDVAKTMEWQD
jgi:hypothetical protein